MSMRNLAYGTVLHYTEACNEKRTERWRVNGATKEWKTRPDEFKTPIKHGLRDYYYLDNLNADKFHKATDCPFGHH